jgi:hypothetical protein
VIYLVFVGSINPPVAWRNPMFKERDTGSLDADVAHIFGAAEEGLNPSLAITTLEVRSLAFRGSAIDP